MERKRRRILERLGEAAVAAAGSASVVIVLLISIFLFRDALLLFREAPLANFFLSTDWFPISEPPRFGVLPLLAGSALVSAGALVLSVPLGIAAALYVSEVAPPWLREWLKPAIEMLAAIPSVVIGFVGYELVAPLLKDLFGLRTGLTALTGSIAIVIVTHNMQQAARVSERTGFFLQGRLVELGPTERIFTSPRERETQDYITGRFG